jgi:tetratricopeptide (TPR) repeat protein
LEQLRSQIEEVKAGAAALERGLQTENASCVDMVEPRPDEAAQAGIRQPRFEIRDYPAAGGLPLEPLAPERPAGSAPAKDQTGVRVVDVQWLTETDQIADPQIDEPGPARPAPNPDGSLLAPAAMDRINTMVPPSKPLSDPGASRAGAPVPPSLRQTTRASDTPSGQLGYMPKSATGAEVFSPDRWAALTDRPRVEAGGGATTDLRADRRGTTSPDGVPQLVGDRELPRDGKGELQSLSQERFDRYMAAAESYLKQGRYYRAAESFTRASTYRPNDGRAYLGKSHALFAAGEYLSSAMLLARAIELNPRAALGQSDLVSAIGGPAVFAGCLTDLEQCAKTGDAPALQFLLAYAYYQMDCPAEAKTALDAAEERLSPRPAVGMLKAALGR